MHKSVNVVFDWEFSCRWICHASERVLEHLNSSMNEAVCEILFVFRRVCVYKTSEIEIKIFFYYIKRENLYDFKLRISLPRFQVRDLYGVPHYASEFSRNGKRIKRFTKLFCKLVKVRENFANIKFNCETTFEKIKKSFLLTLGYKKNCINAIKHGVWSKNYF
jgi:hypothetical protein